MRKHFLIAGFAAACVLSTVACSTTQDTSSWPAPATLQAGEAGAAGLYAAACMTSGKCTPADNKAEADAVKAASDFISGPYTTAYNTGSVTQALLDNEAQLVADIGKIVADIKAGKHKSG